MVIVVVIIAIIAVIAFLSLLSFAIIACGKCCGNPQDDCECSDEEILKEWIIIQWYLFVFVKNISKETFNIIF